MKNFKQFVAEDGGAAGGAGGAVATGGAGTTGPNVTGGLASYESPLGKKKPVAVKEAADPEVDPMASKIKPVTSRGV